MMQIHKKEEDAQPLLLDGEDQDETNCNNDVAGENANYISINHEPRSSTNHDERKLLQQKLRFYFMSPIDKWRTKRRFPFKLVFQLLKIIFVTSQLVNFGNEMSDYLTQDDHLINAFRNILLDDWDQTREVVAYPPATGDYAIYTVEHFYSSLDFAIRKFSNFTDLSVGAFGYEQRNYPKIIFEKSSYLKRELYPSSFTLLMDNKEIKDELLVIDHLYPSGDPRWLDDFGTENYFRQNHFNLSFYSLIKLHLKLPLRTILFEDGTIARCFDMNVTLVYDNQGHDAMIKVKLKLTRAAKSCHPINKEDPHPNNDNRTTGMNDPSTTKFHWIMVLNYTVLVFCSISTMLCIRSLYRGQMLLRETESYFKKIHAQPLSQYDRTEFIDLGLVMICLNDVLIIGGTIMQIRLESSDTVQSDLYNNCSLFLGIGNLLVWLGLLRYFSYFKSYNTLIVTVKKSLPCLLRFCLVAFFLYGGFCFCGWVVLGPHHLKFRTLSSTLECLFSLMNGDDMFATFFSLDVPKTSIIWWFSRIYLYLFISLAIYVIVSLFIAIILDAYESVRDHYELIKKRKKRMKNNKVTINQDVEQDDDNDDDDDDWEKSVLQKFIDEYPLEQIDGRFHNNSIVDQIQHYFRGCFRSDGVQNNDHS